MSTKNCPQCGLAVTDELPGGLCPACLIAVARKSEDWTAAIGKTPSASNGPAIDEIQRLFPELEVLQLIGRGGMGAVYRAKQKNLDRFVALKIFLYKPDDPEFAARFHREAKALARLNHPHIVTVHDFGNRGSLHYLLMEFVNGMNLRQLTAEERLSPTSALQLVPQLCDALQYAHDQGVIHRDIKPENLLLDTHGRIKIADFGLAKLTSGGEDGALTHTRQVMGTLNYMAPEQRERPTEVDHRADIYSLGVVIYEMLTGELPIGRFLPPSAKSELDRRLDEVVLRALEKEPNRRYQQVSEFKSGFTSASDFVPLTAAVPPLKGNQQKRSGFFLSLFSGLHKSGAWLPGNPQLVLTIFSRTRLDLREVRFEEAHLRLITVLGMAKVIVPEDAQVYVDGTVFLGTTREHLASRDRIAQRPVRISSWGALGINSISTSDMPEKSAMYQYRELPHQEFNIRTTIVYLFSLGAFLAMIAAILFYILTSSRMINQIDAKISAILFGAISVWLHTSRAYLRRILNVGPENQDKDSLRQYYASSIIGTLIRWLALTFGLACLMVWIVGTLPNAGSQPKIAGIILGILGGVLYCVAQSLEEFLYGKLKDGD